MQASSLPLFVQVSKVRCTLHLLGPHLLPRVRWVLYFPRLRGSCAGPSSLKTVLAQVCRSPAGFTGYLFLLSV